MPHSRDLRACSRRSAAHRRDVDTRLVEELGGAAEDSAVVLVEAEHDPEVHRDPVPVKHGDEPAVVVHAVVSLVRGGKALLRDRLEAQEQRLASASCGELDELLVPRRVGGALTRPPLPERRERPEELLRVARPRADVVVPEHGTVPVGPRSIEERDGAVVATVRTAARRDRDRLPVSASLDEIPARSRHAGERRLSGRDVDLLELPATGVIEDARPRVLGLAHDDGVGVAGGLLGKSGGMRSADHDGHAAAAKLPREVIGVESGRRGRRDPHEVGRSVEPHRFDDFVRVPDMVLAWGERRDQRHGELGELDQPSAAEQPRRGRLGGDQEDAHGPDRTSRNALG